MTKVSWSLLVSGCIANLQPAQLEPNSRSLPRNYTPFTTRTPWLVSLLVVVLGCIAALEVAFNSNVDSDDDNDPARRVRRQDVSIQTTDPTPTTQTTTSGVDAAQPTDSFITISTTSPSEPVITESYQTTNSFITITTETSEREPETESTKSGDVLTITTPDTTTTPIKSDTTTGGVTAASKESDSFITTDTPPTTAFSQDSDTYITTDTPTSDDIQDLTVVTITPDVTPEPETTSQVTTINSAGSTVTFASVFTPTPTGDTSSPSPSLVTLAVSPTLLTTVVSGSTTVLSTSTTVTASSTSPSLPVGTVKSSQVQITKSFQQHDYFLSSYMGVVLAVTLKLTWGLVFSGLKMLEPFYQLSKPGGATAAESLLADYLSAGYGWNHLRHIFSGHWVMLFSTLTYIAMATLSPIASESMGIVATQTCTNPVGDPQPCAPVWILNKPTGRALEGILIFIAVLILLVIVLNWRRKSGIFSNPSSIATMASHLGHDDMLHDLRHIDPTASDASILAALSGNHYTLKSYSDATGLPRYGITKIDSSAESNPYGLGSLNNFDTAARSKYAAVSNPNNMSLQASPIQEQKPFSVSGRLVRDVIFLLVIFALFGIVLAYYLVGDSSDFNNWLNSGTFGPKFTLTSIAALIDFTWKTIEREVRILVPYRQLAARRAKADKSVLVDVGGVPISSLWGALRRGEVFHSIVAATAISSDVLIIAVGGVPFGRGQVWEAFLYSSYLSLAILGWMALVMLAVFWWRTQIKQLRLPREPDTILSVWLMMADEGNGVLQEYAGWETTRGRERDRAAKSRGARYWGGWAKGQDESQRWCVGVEGLDSNPSLVGYGYGTTTYGTGY